MNFALREVNKKTCGINYSFPSRSGFSLMAGLSGGIPGLSMEAVRAGSVFLLFILDFLSIVACQG